MCGIAGALVFKGSNFNISESYISGMRDTMIHRGPDAAGMWISGDRKVGLAHRRLSIIDLSISANQPMSNEDGTLWCSFNGEIYNHLEIREQLVKTGKHRWKTDHSDTEVIIHAFEEWGIECLHRFRGMFALAIWDVINEELWLIRDRIGIKPLYYSIHDGRVVFASEIKALLKDPQQKRDVNEEAFYHYLSFSTAPAPSTLFQGINKLPGGHFLRVNSRGKAELRCYWDVLDYSMPISQLSEDEVAERLLAELDASVKLHKASDVPMGVFLSGGIDSSTNAALFSKDEKRAIKTFTVGYKGEHSSYRNELDYARFMANEVGADHHELLLTMDDLIDFLPQMIYLQDEPIADPVCFPIYHVSKLARDNGVTVCQVGEGADELFWGYPKWKRTLLIEKYWGLIPFKFLKKLSLLTSKSIDGEEDFRYEKLRRLYMDEPVYWGESETFNDAQKKLLLSERLIKKHKGLTSWEPIRTIYESFKLKARDKSVLNWMTYLELKLRLPELLLMRVDKMSMGVSLEGRVPFLDHKFVEFAMGIPDAMKTRKGILKYIFKKAVRGCIPDELIDRKKQGFGVPIYEWFFGKLGANARIEIKNFCDQSDYLNWPYIERLFYDKKGPAIWRLLNFVLWWKKFIYG